MSADTKESAVNDRRRLTRTGIVISDSMDKTIIVAVERMVQHSRYKRIVRRTSKFYAHDEENTCVKGDRVILVETRPMSKSKRWRVREVFRKASASARAPESAVASEDKGRITKKRGRETNPASQVAGEASS